MSVDLHPVGVFTSVTPERGPQPMPAMFQRFLSAAVVVAVTAALPPAALAQDKAALDKVTQLNKKAIEAYENLDFEEARKLLKQALDVSAAGGLDKHKMRARTHVHLGVVLLAGFKKKEAAQKQFRLALEIQPDIGITKSLVNPEIQAAFDEVRTAFDAENGGGGGGEEGGGEAAPPPPRDTPPDNVQGIYHETVGEGQKGAAVPIKCAVGTDIEFEKVVLAYRPKGASDFLARDMSKDDKGWFAAEIPALATDSDVVAYYIEVRNKQGQPVAASGSAKQPNLVALSDAPPPTKVAQGGGRKKKKRVQQVDEGEDMGGDEPPPGDDEEGGSKRKKKKKKASDEDEEGGERAKHSVFLGLQLGTGFGWTQGSPEVNQYDSMNNLVQISPGIAGAKLLHLAPEIGLYLSDDFIVSVQARVQIITGASPVYAPNCPGGDNMSMNGTCNPAVVAGAVLARATWLFGDGGKLHPYFSLSVGGGTIRHVVNLSPAVEECGGTVDMPGKDPCFDTVKGGPFLAGPGGGLYYDLSDALSLTAGTTALVGVPNFTVNLDINLGIAINL